MIKVIIVDDESLARKLVKSFLADHADIEIMDECANGFDAMKAIQKTNRTSFSLMADAQT
ncbi:MAG: hypothetical protein R2850_05955 [Bacteroidia bacterium]